MIFMLYNQQGMFLNDKGVEIQRTKGRLVNSKSISQTLPHHHTIRMFEPFLSFTRRIYRDKQMFL